MILRVKSPHYEGIRLAISGYHLFSVHEWEIIKLIGAVKETDFKRLCPHHFTGEELAGLFGLSEA